MAVYYNDAGPAITTLCEIGTTTNLPQYGAMGTGVGPASSAATALSSEVETRTTCSGANFSRVTTNHTNDTLQIVSTQTATSGETVSESAVFDQAALGGNMFMSANNASVGPFGLAIGNSYKATWQLKHVSG